MINSIVIKKNKGIAMITIMITIAFLSIIATTLLYISASNYSMKASNALAKNNFYETDAKLVEATTTIRNTAMTTGDPAENIVTNFCVAGTTVADLKDDSVTTYYDITKIPGYGSSGYTYSTSNNIVSCENHPDPSQTNTKRYTFHDIEIKHVSTGGYENSVKTDLIIDVFEKEIPGGGGGGGVGNMSMLLDSPLSSSNADFKNLTMAGNAYVADYVDPTNPVTWVDGHKYIKPGSAGLVMTNESRLNLCGDYNVVYGDLDLSGKSSLAVYGNLTVYGNISVSDSATLILADGAKLYQFKDEVLPGRTANATFTAGTANVYPAGLTPISVTKENFVSFCETVNIKDTTSATGYGLISKIFVKGPKDKNNNQPFGANTRLMEIDLPFDTITINDVTGLTKTSNDLERGYNINSSIYSLPVFGFGIIQDHGEEKSNLNSDNYKNKLMLSFNSKKITLLETCPNTTWISNAPVTCDLQHCVVLTKIGSTEFNYMTAGKGDTESSAYNTTSNPFNNIDINFNGKHFRGKFGAFFEKQCNTTVDNMFGYSAGSGSSSTSTIYKSAANFDNYSRDF